MEFNGLEKLSLVDFDDKLACTLFSSGCNFRCPFCHNGHLVTGKELPIIPWDEIMDYLRKRKGMLDAVTFSGGEPLIHKDIVGRMKEVKSLGYIIKLDTNGYFPGLLKKLVNEGLVDYVAMDIKNSPNKYAETVGLKDFDITPIKESVDFLVNGTVDYEFRTTIMEEFHDEKSIVEMGEFIRGAKREFLQRYNDRDTCLVKGFTTVPKEKALGYKDLLMDLGIPTEIRGYD